MAGKKLLETRDATALRANKLDGRISESRSALRKLLGYAKKLRSQLKTPSSEDGSEGDAGWEEVLQVARRALRPSWAD